MLNNFRQANVYLLIVNNYRDSHFINYLACFHMFTWCLNGTVTISAGPVGLFELSVL